MSDLLPGDHLCYLYDSERERRDAVGLFIRQGLDWHEKIIYIAEPPRFEDVAEGLLAEGVETVHLIEGGQLCFLSLGSMFRDIRRFDPSRMIRTIERETENAVARGFNGLRVTFDTCPVLKGSRGADRLLEFEHRLNGFFPGSRCLALCQYHREHFNPTLFHQVLSMHPGVLLGDSVHRNPYYVLPPVPGTLGTGATDVQAWLERLGAGEGPDKAVGSGSSGMVATLFRWDYPEVLEQYLDELSEVAVAILDRDKNILHCNRGFLRLLHQSDDPAGRNLADFLVEGSLKSLPFPPPGAHKKTRLNFVPKCRVVHTLNCFIFGTFQGYVVLGERITLTNNDVLAGISNLTNELANMTRELQKKNIALERANAIIGELTNTDPLTGMPNRRPFMEELGRAMSLARRHGVPLSLTMGTPDLPENLNDALGADRGDEALKAFAAILQSSCRKEDFSARLDGGEFAVILPHTDLAGAAIFAERTRKSFTGHGPGEGEGQFAASFGVTRFTRDDTPESFIQRASEALDQARKAGGDRVEAR